MSIPDSIPPRRRLTPLPHCITPADLAVYGLTAAEVRKRWPAAVEYTALDGSPCWLREDLDGLMAGGEA
jgi:hypothetical protein